MRSSCNASAIRPSPHTPNTQSNSSAFLLIRAKFSMASPQRRLAPSQLASAAAHLLLQAIKPSCSALPFLCKQLHLPPQQHQTTPPGILSLRRGVHSTAVQRSALHCTITQLCKPYHTTTMLASSGRPNTFPNRSPIWHQSSNASNPKHQNNLTQIQHKPQQQISQHNIKQMPHC